MLTRFERISTIHGCSIIFQGLARRLGCFSRLKHCQQILIIGQDYTYQHSIKYLKLSLQ